MGGSVAFTRKNRIIGGIKNKEVLITLACISDSAAGGTIPDIDLEGLGEHALDEVQPIPDPGADDITAAFDFIIVDADGSEVYDAAITVADKTRLDGPTGSPTSHPARMDDTMTVKFVQPGDHSTSQDVGSSKKIVMKLRFLLKR